MRNFDKLISVLDNRFDVSFNQEATLSDLLMVSNGDIRYYLKLQVSYDTYVTINLNEYIINEALPLTMTIAELVEAMTDQELYTYNDKSVRNFENIVQHVNFGDFASEVAMRSCNMHTGEISELLDDPDHNDIKITIKDRDMAGVFPVLDNLIRKPIWYEGDCYIENSAKDLISNPELTFIAFNGNDDITILTIEESRVGIPTGTFPVVVLDGTMWEPTSDLITFNSSGGMIYNDKVVDFFKYERDKELTMEEFYQEKDSFVVCIKCNTIVTRYITSWKETARIHNFVTNDPNVICISTDGHELIPAVMTKDATYSNGVNNHYLCYLATCTDKLTVKQFIII